MSGPGKKQILEALRQGQEQAGLSPASRPDLDLPREVPWLPAEAPWQRARQSLLDLGDDLHLAASRPELREIVRQVVDRHQIRVAAREFHPWLDGLGLEQWLAQDGVELADLGADSQAGRAELERADLGITLAQALAEDSATLVLAAGAGRPRAVSLTPMVHLALVPADRRVAMASDLIPFIEGLARSPQGLPSALTWISGHSRTGDIELVLIPGVHGPGALHVVGLCGQLLAELRA